MAALSKVEIRETLKKMPGWSFAGIAIHKRFTFKSFMPAIAFVNKIAEAAEQATTIPTLPSITTR